jgi:hypothetical protein
MSTKTEIRKFLAAGHDTFTTNQIAAITGLPIKTISTAANQMCKSGELVVESRTGAKRYTGHPGLLSRKTPFATNAARTGMAIGSTKFSGVHGYETGNDGKRKAAHQRIDFYRHCVAAW